VMCGVKLARGASSSICDGCRSGHNTCGLCGMVMYDCECELDGARTFQ
jgi:hypothetical protein